MVGLRVAVLAWPAHSSPVPHPLRDLGLLCGLSRGRGTRTLDLRLVPLLPDKLWGTSFFHLGLNSKFGRVGLTQANSL